MTPTLRPYQSAAIEAVRGEYLAGRRSTLVVLPTGTGKTVVFAEVARRSVERGRRVLVLAHRGELLEQAAAKLAAVGVEAAIEKASQRAGDAPVVVASVQTLKGARLASWAPDAFGLVVIDEAHHAPAAGYRAVLDRFAGARVLGVTATPDRLDGQGLGAVFESVAYRLELRQAIRDGWLAPLRARRVAVHGVDLADVRTRAGDLDRAELAAVMAAEEALHGVAAPLVELVGDRRTILFAVDVAHARGLADVLCRYRPGVARAVDGEATSEERAAALADFRAGRFQILVNCALFTEGFDEPTVSCVAIARPTKSRALLAQMIGRGTRLAPGKVDCLVLDFAGNVGRHRLVGPADVLAGAADLAADVRAEVEAMLGRGEQLELGDVLDQADLEASRRRSAAAVTAVARYQAEEIDPFVGALPAPGEAGPAATDAQRAALVAFGLDDVPAALSRATAARWIDALAAPPIRTVDAAAGPAPAAARLRRARHDVRGGEPAHRLARRQRVAPPGSRVARRSGIDRRERPIGREPMTVILGIDPGLATCGVCALRLPAREVLGADVFRSAPSPRKRQVAASDDRYRRARVLAAWLEAGIDRWRPAVLAAEAMSFPRGAKAIAAMALSWGAIAAIAERRGLPLVQASPQDWRQHATGRKGASDADLYALLRERGGAEVEADLLARGLPRGAHGHAVDALGVALALAGSEVVRAAVSAGASPIAVVGQTALPPAEQG